MPDSATPWTVAPQTPWSMGFSRHEYWSGLLLLVSIRDYNHTSIYYIGFTNFYSFFVYHLFSPNGQCIVSIEH